MPFELYVRFGRAEDAPRDVQTFTFQTEAERTAFINGMWALYENRSGNYDITEKDAAGDFLPDPELNEDEEEA